ncbi:MAG: DUF4124 domain-containing protein [Burkholderiaceae bacterium]
MAKCSALLLSLICTALMASAAHAQFKWIDANGRIGYGDRLPDHKVKVLKSPVGRTVQAAASSNDTSVSDLPFELRNVTRRAPVVLYTSRVCDPCDLARQHLVKRGIPFSEKQVNSARDVAAFRDLGFPTDSGLPVVTSGETRQIGYHGARWDDMLSKSGYPRKSLMPSNYSGPTAQPLAAASQSIAAETEGFEPRASVLSRQRNAPSARKIQEARLRF